MLARAMPNVAPFSAAIVNANSSAAARVDAINRIGGARSRNRARAASRRAAAEGSTIAVTGVITMGKKGFA
jgi:hypothetical protein